MRALLIGSLVLCGGCCEGCAVRSYRVVTQGSNAVLVPPGATGAAVQRRTFVAGVPAGTCKSDVAGPVAVDVRGKRLHVTVQRDELVREPPNWLSGWAAELEASGCIAAGTGWQLANEVAESVPLDTRAVFRLVYGEAVDIGSPVRIQVDSPVLRDEAEGLASGPMTVTEMPGGLKVELKATANLIGYERAWYGAKPKSGGNGARIVPMSAERHIGGATEQRTQPQTNYFLFPSEAGYYRLIYKQDQTNFTALVVAGRTRSELDEHAGKLSGGTASCDMVESGYCLAIPKGVGANLFLPVTVNGKEELVHWGATVHDAIRYPGHRAEAAIPTLTVSKLYNGKPAPVEFNRSDTAILGLRLTGGETISWH